MTKRARSSFRALGSDAPPPPITRDRPGRTMHFREVERRGSDPRPIFDEDELVGERADPIG
jgi:hypothetical protein